MNGKINLLRLGIKTAILIALIAFVLIPITGSAIGKFSLYNRIIPGRKRLPYSEYPSQAYSLSLYNLEAMISSHEIARKQNNTGEFRVFILGDSSTWGTLLEPENTLAGQLNQLGLTISGGTPLRFYNLGYPTLALSKDLLLLEEALQYDPDLIIWLFTLESFPSDKQISSPIVKNNTEKVSQLFSKYQLSLIATESDLKPPTYWERTLFGQRRNLADIFRLQLYGVMWAITGIDQYYPPEYEKAARDLSDDNTYHGWKKGEMTANDLSIEILLAGKKAAKDIPILYVNEPILISKGVNSEVRYNFYYPKWAYDDYRTIIGNYMRSWDLLYLDQWDIVPEKEFTNTAIHSSPKGVQIQANDLANFIIQSISP